MDHTEFNQLLAVYTLGACDPAEIRAVQAHLSECVPCRSEANELNELARWLSVTAPAVPPPSLRARVLRNAQR